MPAFSSQEQRRSARRRWTKFSGFIPIGMLVKVTVCAATVVACPARVANAEVGMTESATVVCSTTEDDICQGTSGPLIPGTRAKILDIDGREITEYGKAGELFVQSPSVTLGYLNNEKATAEAFVWDEDGRWLRTGDEVMVTKSPKGWEHITVVDRLKELIKVKVCRGCSCLHIIPNPC